MKHSEEYYKQKAFKYKIAYLKEKKRIAAEMTGGADVVELSENAAIAAALDLAVKRGDDAIKRIQQNTSSTGQLALIIEAIEGVTDWADTDATAESLSSTIPLIISEGKVRALIEMENEDVDHVTRHAANDATAAATAAAAAEAATGVAVIAAATAAAAAGVGSDAAEVAALTAAANASEAATNAAEAAKAAAAAVKSSEAVLTKLYELHLILSNHRLKYQTHGGDMYTEAADAAVDFIFFLNFNSISKLHTELQQQYDKELQTDYNKYSKAVGIIYSADAKSWYKINIRNKYPLSGIGSQIREINTHHVALDTGKFATSIDITPLINAIDTTGKNITYIRYNKDNSMSDILSYNRKNIKKEKEEEKTRTAEHITTLIESASQNQIFLVNNTDNGRDDLNSLILVAILAKMFKSFVDFHQNQPVVCFLTIENIAVMFKISLLPNKKTQGYIIPNELNTSVAHLLRAFRAQDSSTYTLRQMNVKFEMEQVENANVSDATDISNIVFADDDVHRRLAEQPTQPNAKDDYSFDEQSGKHNAQDDYSLEIQEEVREEEVQPEEVQREKVREEKVREEEVQTGEVREDKVKISKEFKKYDTDGDGNISITELVRGYLGIGQGMDEALTAFKQYDTDNSLTLSFDEFLTWSLGTSATKEWDDITSKILAAFKLYDVNEDGSINISELARGYSANGQEFTDAVNALKTVDGDGNGTLDLEEFRKWSLETGALEDWEKRRLAAEAAEAADAAGAAGAAGAAEAGAAGDAAEAGDAGDADHTLDSDYDNYEKTGE